MEKSYLLDKEFKVIVIKILIKLCREVDKLNENFNEEVKIVKKKKNYQN